MEIFLYTQKIDVCLISETHFTNQSYIKIKGYATYHTIHPSNQGRGGSAIIIRENIKHYEEEHIQREKTQLTILGIDSTKQKLKLGAIYCPPRYNSKKDDFKNIFLKLGQRLIVGGDYNTQTGEQN